MGGFFRILQVVEALKAEEALQALEDVQNLPICAAREEQQKKVRLFSLKVEIFPALFSYIDVKSDIREE